MQETATFKLNVVIDKASKTTLQKALLENIQQMDFRIFLSPYFRKNGGVVEGIVEVKNLIINDNLTGAFKVLVNVNTYNACLVIDAFDKEELDITYIIDEKYQFIKMTGPLWPDREPDDI